MIIGLIALLIMVIIHEWGHFIAGRICKLPVYEFSIGMGPLLFQHQGKKETKWSIRLLPIGGYCAFDNLEDASSTKNGITDLALDTLSIPKRIFICAAGPFMNILFAFIITFILMLSSGNVITTTKIMDVVEGSVAENQIMAGDHILMIDGIDVCDKREKLTNSIQNSNGKTLEIVLDRNGETKTVFVTPEKKDGTYFLGIMQLNEFSSLPISKAIPKTFSTMWQYTKGIIDGFIGILNRKYGLNDVSGVVGVVDMMSGYATKNTIRQFVMIIALVSMNLGLVNLAPIPGLDGSKICYSIYEAVTKKKPNPKIISTATGISMAILLGFMILITISDLMKIFG
jgi:regulator of sigma E protease